MWVKPQEEIELGLRHNEQVVARVDEVAGFIEATAIALARVRAFESGAYMAGIEIHDLEGAGKAVVATADHSWFVEVGTGEFGPFHRPVIATGNWFKFTVMDGGVPRTVVTDLQVGRPARHVMRDAAIQVASLPGLYWSPNDATG